MKTLLSITFILATILPLFAQQTDGTFRANNDYMIFSGNNIAFSVSGFAGLLNVQTGEGTFEIVDDFLIIHTSDFSGERTRVETLPGTLNDSIVVRVIDENNFAVQTVFVEAFGRTGRFFRRSDNRIERQITNNHGVAYITKNDDIRRIAVSGMGFDNISFEYNPANDYRVTIARHEVLENTTVVFRFNRVNDETLAILLLTTNFEEGRNRTRALERLERQSRRHNRLARHLRKEHVPFVPSWL